MITGSLNVKHKIELIKTERLEPTDNIVRRALTLNIDDVIVEGVVSYEGSFNYKKLSPHNVYKIRLKNKSVSKHPDYKEMRLEILRKLYKADNTVAKAVVERDLTFL